MAAQRAALDYIIKTWVGKLKVGELVFTLLAGACGSSVLSYVNTCSCVLKFSFFGTVAWTAFINALIDMIIHLLGLWERLLWIFRHSAVHTVLCVLAVIGFLIGSSLAASCAKDVCATQKSTAGAASLFGFDFLALFALECFLHFKEYRSMQAKLMNNLPRKISRQITISKKNLQVDLELCEDVFKTTHIPFPALGI